MATFNPFGATTYTLASSISSTATSITLTSFTEPVTGTPYTMVLLNTDIVYATIAPKTAQSEFISFTGITQNADGTATLTGVTRGLAKKSPFTTSSDYKLPHSGQTKFIISNAPQLFNEYVTLNNTETIDGLKTFSTFPVSGAGLPVSGTQFATKQYVDNTATGTTNTNRIIVAGTAGETVAVDQIVYLKASDGRWWLADADTASTDENVILGITQGSGTAGNAITNGVLISGLNTFSGLTLTANTKYYVSNTAGGFSSSAGTTEVTVGESQTTTTFLWCPRFDQQLTEDQQDALAGTSGTPSATNLFVTANDASRNYNTVAYAASSAGTDTYAVTLSPAAVAYANGMVVRFKTDVANTGAATLNVNGIGAISIVTGISTALVTGDIVANQVVEVVYNSTGTVFQLMNPASAVLTTTAYTNGEDSYAVSTASGVKNIAHGLGRVPKKVRLTFMSNNSVVAGTNNSAVLVYNGTTKSCVGRAGANGAARDMNGTDIILYGPTSGSELEFATGVLTWDATNIILTFTKTNSPTGTYDIVWEAEG